MIGLDDRLVRDQLTGYGDCNLHYHLEDRAKFPLNELEYTSINSISTVTSNYTATETDGYIYVDTTAGNITVTLPAITTKNEGKEIEVAWVGGTYQLTVAPTGSDTIIGQPDVIYTELYTSLRYKATTGMWVII